MVRHNRIEQFLFKKFLSLDLNLHAIDSFTLVLKDLTSRIQMSSPRVREFNIKLAVTRFLPRY